MANFLIITKKKMCFEYDEATAGIAAKKYIENELLNAGRCSLTATEWSEYYEVVGGSLNTVAKAIAVVNSVIKSPMNRIERIVTGYTTSFPSST